MWLRFCFHLHKNYFITFILDFALYMNMAVYVACLSLICLLSLVINAMYRNTFCTTWLVIMIFLMYIIVKNLISCCWILWNLFCFVAEKSQLKNLTIPSFTLYFSWWMCFKWRCQVPGVPLLLLTILFVLPFL